MRAKGHALQEESSSKEGERSLRHGCGTDTLAELLVVERSRSRSLGWAGWTLHA